MNDKIIEEELKRAKKDGDLPLFDLDKIEIHLAKTCNITCSWCYGRDVVPEISERRALKSSVVKME